MEYNIAAKTNAAFMQNMVMYAWLKTWLNKNEPNVMPMGNVVK